MGVGTCLNHPINVRFTPDAVAHLSTVYDGSPEPQTYWESLHCPDAANWWIAISTDFDNIEQKGVWKVRPKIGARWLFARKDDGLYCACCVAKGFSQLLGIYF
jgi:hypothetical protein